MSKLKLEVGKSYKTREGYRAIIIEVGKHSFRVAVKGVADAGVWEIIEYTLYGHKYDDGTASYYDLIEEWVEPLDFDWDCLPKWADKAIAMTQAGWWNCYSHKDLNKSDGWWYRHQEHDTVAACRIPPEYEPKNFTGSWEDSLFVNPKYQEGKK